MREHAYGFAVETDLGIEEAEQKVREALAEEGFGILTEIDVAATLKTKLGVDRSPYKILGACNPDLANRALGIEEDIGLLLPCNVVLYQKGDTTVVEAIEPRTMSQITANEALSDIAEEARTHLVKALTSI